MDDVIFTGEMGDSMDEPLEYTGEEYSLVTLLCKENDPVELLVRWAREPEDDEDRRKLELVVRADYGWVIGNAELNDTSLDDATKREIRCRIDQWCRAQAETSR